jgi:acyl-CoA thioesterase-1
MQQAFDWVSSGYGALARARNLLWAIPVTACAASAEPVTIVALGDSLTAGYGLDTAEGFVPQMQAWLDAQGADVELINAGVSGDTSGNGLARTDWTLTPDVDGMIVALGGNDYLRGLPPELLETNLGQIVDKAQAQDVQVMLIGLSVGGNYGADYKSDFEAVFARIAEVSNLPLYADWFAGLQAAAGDGSIAPYMQDDGIHPNAEGVRLIVAALGPTVLEFAQTVE